jgi:hypothetical protein
MADEQDSMTRSLWREYYRTVSSKLCAKDLHNNHVPHTLSLSVSTTYHRVISMPPRSSINSLNNNARRDAELQPAQVRTLLPHQFS